MYNKLKQKIKLKKFSVGIIGLGYVGLPLAVKFIKKGIKVFGVDQDITKIQKQKKGISYIESIKTAYFKKNPQRISTQYSLLKNCDVIFICLPTPLKRKKPDLSYIFDCVKNLKPHISSKKLIILESTVYPGVTRKIKQSILGKNLKVGKDIFIGYSPERENPGDKKFSYKITPKVISGYSDRCLKLVDMVYSYIVKKRHKTISLEIAEMSKLLENLYRAVNIGLVNEFKMICDKLNIDVLDVINAASSKNFGFKKFEPGPGWGGHCIPIDPFYLSWLSIKSGYEPKLIKNTGIINRNMPSWILKKIFSFFSKKKIKKIKILLLGITYKKNVDDDRESPAFHFMKILDKKKIAYNYSDPFFSRVRSGRKIKKTIKSIKLNSVNLKKHDCAIVIADHDVFNYKFIAKHSKIVFDTRGVYRKLRYKKTNNIINV
jgi:UDP-N-acetyl-D-glucosamine dehydrogenase